MRSWLEVVSIAGKWLFLSAFLAIALALILCPHATIHSGNLTFNVLHFWGLLAMPIGLLLWWLAAYPISPLTEPSKSALARGLAFGVWVLMLLIFASNLYITIRPELNLWLYQSFYAKHTLPFGPFYGGLWVIGFVLLIAVYAKMTGHPPSFFWRLWVRRDRVPEQRNNHGAAHA